MTSSPFDEATSSPLTPWIILVIVVVVAIIIFLLQRKRKILRASNWTRTIIKDFSSELPGLTLSYNQQPVQSASVSKVVFWNQGESEVRDSDLPSEGKLKLIVQSPAKLLDARLLASSNPRNKFDISGQDANSGEVRLSFEYLGPHDGAAIQLVHTGTSKSDLIVVGEIMGYKKVEFVDPWRRWPPVALLSLALLWTILGIAIIFNLGISSWLAALILVGPLVPTVGGYIVVIGRAPSRIMLKPPAPLRTYVLPFTEDTQGASQGKRT